MEALTTYGYNFVTVAVALVAVIISISKWRYNYWQRRGLETLPVTIPFGTAKFFNNVSPGERFKRCYDLFKAKGLRHGGIYIGFKVGYVPTDLEIIKCIMQKDFNHFVNRGLYFNEEVEPLSAHLFNLEDARWRNLRIKLTPTFTSGKMKMMFHTLVDCTRGLEDLLDSYATSKTSVDIKDVLARFSTDIIGSCAFGIECNSLREPDSEFRSFGKRIFEFTKIDRYKRIFRQLMPRRVIRCIKMKFMDPQVEHFFMSTVKNTIDYREKNNIQRKDFMQLLIQMRNKENSEGLTIEEIAAQSFVFFIAGFETSSTTMTYALFELASNQDIQDKVREEIRRVLVRHEGQITYEGIMEMTYMDQVVDETLRKYPPVPIIPRVCTKDYVVPGTTVKLSRGTFVAISALGVQRDPEHYPNPDKFDPERFSEENRTKLPPFAWIPFGEGPRICIGLRFGVMQSKVGLTAVLRNYRVTLNHKTQSPLQISPNTFVLAAKGGIWLNVERIKTP